jgi:murein DD-endopeptidase MepM/ murein hydrolase activator NlpD/dienelactone hydrolase
MRFPTILACLLMTITAAADDDLTVLRGGPDGSTPRAMLSVHLKEVAGKAFDARRAAVSATKTPDDLARRQRELKGKFLEALGDLPEKTPLRARVVGTEARDGYRLERVIYESRPDHHVTALFYLPGGMPPFPAVLMPCGHDANGKAAAAYQRACILLARNGIAALCYVPIGQAERRQLLGPDGKPAGPGNTAEHTMIGIGALLVGRSTAGYRVWDGIRSLDYLASRPEIDPHRLGCTGCSGGGTLTSYLMALDDRVVAAAPSCYITSLERLFATIGPQDAEQNITGQVAFGLEHADYLGLRAPRPTLVLSSSRDFFDQQGTWTTFREAKRTYGLLGHPERVDIIEADEAHGYPRAHREAMARWMRLWLLGKDGDAPAEAEAAIARDADLLCTKSGQVLADLHGKSAFDLNAEREGELARRRSGSGKARDRAALLADVRRLIALRGPIERAVREDRGEARWGSGTVRKLVFSTEPGIEVPARLFTPGNVDGAAPLAVVVGYEAAEAVGPDGPVEDLLARGRRVLVADLRGMGETAPAPGRPGPFGVGVQEAFLSLHLGRPLLGQRVGDLLSMLAALAGESSGGFSIVGHGTAGPIALHAAALEPRVVALTLDGAITSWSDVVRTPITNDQLANVVPGVLASYDLPDLAASLAPRPLIIRAAVDPTGRPMARERVESAHAVAAEAYRGLGAGSALTVKDGPPRPSRVPLVRAVDLSVGESQSVALADGKKATVKLLGVVERRDPIRSAVREATVKVEVNGAAVALSTGNYQLPTSAGGVQLDCPITGGYRSDSGEDLWGLVKDARIRLWPGGSPWIEPSSFVYPARQRWFASSTQMANEPAYVDGGEKPATPKTYYHNGLDIGGAEGLVEVVAATDGVVISSGTDRLAGTGDSPARPRYDVVYVLDDRGWYYRYSHMKAIDPAIVPGAAVRMGQKIGTLGKEGGSGGWSHLHFEITSRQTSGRWGTQEGYAFLWQAYLRERKPEILAVARPHHLAGLGEPVVLDGSRSWAQSGPVASFEWTFGDGTTATGPRVERTYARPGSYSEILKVTDRFGRVDYDFAVVQVLDRSRPTELPPTIHAAYAPTLGIRPGDPVTFKVRTFRTTDGRETCDFGDGTPTVEVHSDGNVDQHARDGYAITTHRFEKPGHYLVRVERTDRRGATATARLHVVVEGASGS